MITNVFMHKNEDELRKKNTSNIAVFALSAHIKNNTQSNDFLHTTKQPVA